MIKLEQVKSDLSKYNLDIDVSIIGNIAEVRAEDLDWDVIFTLPVEDLSTKEVLLELNYIFDEYGVWYGGKCPVGTDFKELRLNK